MALPVVLITGCSSGIGLACAERFARGGYRICGVDLEYSPGLAEVFSRAEGLFFRKDVCDFPGSRQVAEEAGKHFGSIDALVTCAGISRDANLLHLSEEDWDRVLAVDLKGTFNYIRSVSPWFERQGRGKVVTIASTAALRARRGISNYIAAKAGVAGLTRAAARELGRFNVNVNCIAPGLVLTDLAGKIPPDIREKLREETCLGRFAQPMDVANVAFFLCSEEARHITGEVIRVDGGQLA